MNHRRLLCAVLGLLLGLLFYLAYRSSHTVSNRLIGYTCGPTAYEHLKQSLRHWLPVPLMLRGCLPSALWCFIATSLLGGWKIRRGKNRPIPLAWLCPVFNAGWEVVQWLGWTDGRADWQDALAGLAGWGLARLIFIRGAEPAEIALRWGWQVGVAVAGFACMGFADVWK